MKKVLILLVLMIGFLSASAQVARTHTALPDNVWFIPTYTGVTTGTSQDTLGTVTATTWSYTVPVNKFDGVFFALQIKLADKTTGAAGACTVQPQGRYFSDGSWANIGSAVTWTGIGSTDSTITITSVSSKVYYPYIRTLVTNTSGKSKVVSYKFLIKK